MTTNDVDDQYIFKSLRYFLIAALPAGVEIVQAQDNFVPMPLGGFVSMNNVGQNRLGRSIVNYADSGTNPGHKKVETHVEYTMQVDFFGPESNAWATTVQALFSDDFAFDLFPVNIKPLYADGPTQIPLITGEEVYLQRWKLMCVMQVNPVITIDQDFADALSIGVKEIDATFPP